MLCSEDFAPGQVRDMGSHEFAGDEIVASARQYDPQRRPGHRLALRSTVLEARPSGSRPTLGLVRFRWEAHDSSGTVVLSPEGWQLFQKR